MLTKTTIKPPEPILKISIITMATQRDPAASQLIDYARAHTFNVCKVTNTAGGLLKCLNSSQRAGPKGPILLQDTQLIEELSSLARERIPARVVHAKGTSAFGYFEVTHDITQYTAACVFKTIGKKTPIAVRFSQSVQEKGSFDMARDIRGFAVKFYTEDGIWDLVGVNFPVFGVRDPILFPSFVHCNKKNPVSHLDDLNAVWDFYTLTPQTTHFNMYMFSDRGIPKNYRHMDGFGVHAFSFVNSEGVLHFAKIHLKTEQGVDYLEENEANQIGASDPDHFIRDLYNSIAAKNFPAWKMHIQLMTQQQAQEISFDPFDPTKVWNEKDYPLIPVGRLVLNRNPDNHFAETEQLGFLPGSMIPGIATSPDKLLQGRILAYKDALNYRLGVNHNQLPVNRPFKAHNYLRDGNTTIDNQNGAPNYHPNTYNGPEISQRARDLMPKFEVRGSTGYYESNASDEDFIQPGNFYRTELDEAARERLISNIVKFMDSVEESLQIKVVEMFGKVDQDFGRRLGLALKA